MTTKPSKAINLSALLAEAEALALEWLDFSREGYGWDTREYGDWVRCYFADTNDHRSVRFGVYGEQVEIGMHRPAHFGGMTLRAVDALPKIIAQARTLLEEEKAEAVKRGAEEVESERQLRIQRLREQLAAMEAA